jgi:RNA polymerase sigma factor (sigma-70 family)
MLAQEQLSSSGERATVYIVDHDPQMRHLLSALARSVGLAIEIFADAKEFLCTCQAESHGCAVLDVRLPMMSGLDLQKALLARNILLPIIFVSAHGDVPMVAQAFRAGAIDFMQKPFNVNVMLERIYEAIKRDEIQHRRHEQNQELEKRLSQLSKREAVVMQLLIEGASTKSIARQLAISPKTVDNHRVRILQKVQVGNTVELAKLVFSKPRTGHDRIGAPPAWMPFVDGLPRREDEMSLSAR